MSAKFNLGKMKESSTLFFLCDMQEKFRPVISFYNEILLVAKRLVEASSCLNIPLIVTEQYPKGLGKTVEELNVDHATLRVEKEDFTMLVPEVLEFLRSHDQYRHIVLFGVETHVCIQQTVIDLLEIGYDVHIVADASSSRNQMDRKFALQRFQQIGAFVTTSEGVLFQLIGSKNHPKFKEIQNLIKVVGPTSGLLQ
ncbi:hypothetical protein HELRODRAFT_105234 [Helobdella robusta]|uniref:Isochorismatase-like domain-containing protein n=1 Tax=Helobdella robusta TaxID=6412 RepID=T1EDR9_HELRO|nr:hypothetical protein HELRODRAFT_105234 [Helobdella robusta]ESO12223.1 hypothetical protein HELRODRAFT_105234 [Helobdella robusta]